MDSWKVLVIEIQIHEKMKIRCSKEPEEFAYYDQAPDYSTRMNGISITIKEYETL